MTKPDWVLWPPGEKDPGPCRCGHPWMAHLPHSQLCLRCTCGTVPWHTPQRKPYEFKPSK